MDNMTQNNINVMNRLIKKTGIKQEELISRHKEVYKFITDNYPNKSTERSYISNLAMVYKHLGNDILYEKYSNIGIKKQLKIQKEASKQGLSEKQLNNYVSWCAILGKRTQLKKRLDLDGNMKFLILCLYSYQEPIRQDYNDMLIIDDESKDDKINNFLLIKNDKMYFILNQYKTVKTFGPKKFIVKKKLREVIKTSLKLHFRKHLLVNKDKEPLTKADFFNYSNNIWKDKNVGVSQLRSAYICQKYKNKRFTIYKKQLLANKMLHSLYCADMYYNKLIDVPEMTKQEKITIYQQDNPDVFAKASKKYYEANSYEIGRKKMLKRLNNNPTQRPSPQSIEKYKLQILNNIWV